MNEYILSDLKYLNVICLRYFNPIGAHSSGLIGENPKNTLSSNIMPNIINVLQGKKEYLYVFGNDYDTPDGTAIRDYIDVNDLSAIHIMCLKNISLNSSLILNCGYGYGYSVLEIIKKFEEVTGKHIKINFKKRRKGDIAVAISDNKNLIKKINFNLGNIKKLEQSINTALLWEKKLKQIKKNKNYL
jgi:UDP-glucose 4-epimerase